MNDALLGHLWQAYGALRRGSFDHAEEHLKAAMNLGDPGKGIALVSVEPCLLTGQPHHRPKVERQR